jgi:hypothetical protein
LALLGRLLLLRVDSVVMQASEKPQHLVFVEVQSKPIIVGIGVAAQRLSADGGFREF